MREGLSAPPVAQFGYAYFDPPKHWPVADLENVGDRWVIHTAPGHMFEATVERPVGGYLGCGWGEVLFSSEGYEARSISLLEYSPEGFHPAAINLSGCC